MKILLPIKPVWDLIKNPAKREKKAGCTMLTLERVHDNPPAAQFSPDRRRKRNFYIWGPTRLTDRQIKIPDKFKIVLFCYRIVCSTVVVGKISLRSKLGTRRQQRGVISRDQSMNPARVPASASGLRASREYKYSYVISLCPWIILSFTSYTQTTLSLLPRYFPSYVLPWIRGVEKLISFIEDQQF